MKPDEEPCPVWVHVGDQPRQATCSRQPAGRWSWGRSLPSFPSNFHLPQAS